MFLMSKLNFWQLNFFAEMERFMKKVREFNFVLIMIMSQLNNYVMDNCVRQDMIVVLLIVLLNMMVIIQIVMTVLWIFYLLMKKIIVILSVITNWILKYWMYQCVIMNSVLLISVVNKDVLMILPTSSLIVIMPLTSYLLRLIVTILVCKSPKILIYV